VDVWPCGVGRSEKTECPRVPVPPFVGGDRDDTREGRDYENSLTAAIHTQADERFHKGWR